MTAPNTIKIDNVEYVRADVQTQGEIKIAVLDRGFVYVGRVSDIDDNFLVMKSALNIRKWGTTRGLGELVNGPTNNTVLDEIGTIRVPMKAVITLIDVDQAKWKV